MSSQIFTAGTLKDLIINQTELFSKVIVDILLLLLAPFIFLYERAQAQPANRKFKSILITGASSGLGEGLAVG